MCILLEKVIDVEIVATSGLRTPEENAKVGGVPNSSHLKGLAIDFSCGSGILRYKIIFGAVAVGFKRIGIAKDHIHLDVDPDKPLPTVFLEN